MVSQLSCLLYDEFWLSMTSRLITVQKNPHENKKLVLSAGPVKLDVEGSSILRKRRPEQSTGSAATWPAPWKTSAGVERSLKKPGGCAVAWCAMFGQEGGRVRGDSATRPGSSEPPSHRLLPGLHPAAEPKPFPPCP